MSYNYLPNSLWYNISEKYWSGAEEKLRLKNFKSKSIGCVSGISQGTHKWADDNHRHRKTGSSGEYPLTTALRMKAPDSLILALLDAHEDAASVKDMNGLLPLHLAIQENYTLDVIKAIFAKYSDALKASGTYEGGRVLPLHLALRLKRKDELICFLLEEYNEASKVPFDNGNLPIHIAISNNYPRVVVSNMVAAFPESCKAQNHEGNLPIHCAILKCNSSSLATENPDARLQNCTHEDLLDRKAFPKNCSLDLLKVLVNAFPGSCVTQNKSCGIPLRIAFNVKSSHTVIHLLAASFSDFLTRRQENPVHVALKNKMSFAVPLLVMYHDADVMVKNDNGDLPIHIAIENRDGTSAKAISLLVGLYPSSLVEKGRLNLTPLNLAVKYKAGKAVIAEILKAYASLVGDMKVALLQQKVDDTNRLPLHIGILCGLPTMTLIDMMQSYPDAVRVLSTHPNGANYLPIDHAVDCGCEAEVVVAMLLLFPESCCRTCTRYFAPTSQDELSAIAQIAINKPAVYWLQRKSKGSLDLKFLQKVMSDLRNESAGTYVFEEANDEFNLDVTGNNKCVPSDDDPPYSSLVDGAELSLFREMEALRKKLTDSDASIDELKDEFDRFKLVMNEKLEVVERGTLLAISRLRDDDLLA